MEIRPATVEDAPAIAKVHVDSWKSTYKDIMSAEYLSNLSYGSREDLWKTVIPGGGVFVALNDSKEIVGFASGGKERSKEYAGYDGEVYAIYLLEHAQRKGIGRKLIQAVVQDLHKKQIYSMIIWVLEDNPSTLFYQALGGQIIDKMNIEMDGKILKEIAFGWKQIDFL
ncbi:N-acetyltransferase family protein [Bacillus sp. AK128]